MGEERGLGAAKRIESTRDTTCRLICVSRLIIVRKRAVDWSREKIGDLVCITTHHETQVTKNKILPVPFEPSDRVEEGK